MANRDAFQRYLDAGIAFTNITRAKAEELVQELVQSGEFQSDDARAKVEELIERSRKGREALVAQVRHEVTRQLEGWASPASRTWPSRWPPARPHRRSRQGGQAGTKKTAAQEGPGEEGAGQEVGRPRRPRPRRRRPRRRRPRSPPPPKAAAKKAPAKKAPGKKAPVRRRHRPRVGGLTRSPRQRLDRALVERGLAESRPQAVALIEQGRGAGLRVGGRQAGPPGVAATSPSSCSGHRPRSSSRGGDKLDAGPGPVRHRSDRTAGPRRRGLDRWVHRLPAPGRRRLGGRRRRRPRPAPPAAARTTPGWSATSGWTSAR